MSCHPKHNIALLFPCQIPPSHLFPTGCLFHLSAVDQLPTSLQPLSISIVLFQPPKWQCVHLIVGSQGVRCSSVGQPKYHWHFCFGQLHSRLNSSSITCSPGS